MNTIAAVYRAQPRLHEALWANREAVIASYQGVEMLIRMGDPERGRQIVREVLESIDKQVLAKLAELGGASVAVRK